jgi:hypothetical protein
MPASGLVASPGRPAGLALGGGGGAEEAGLLAFTGEMPGFEMLSRSIFSTMTS